MIMIEIELSYFIVVGIQFYCDTVCLLQIFAVGYVLELGFNLSCFSLRIVLVWVFVFCCCFGLVFICGGHLGSGF